METAPSQDPPKHILNILNDDCIQAILRRITNLQDFLSAAETCKRFQSNAKVCFRTKYGLGDISFLGNCLDDLRIMKSAIPLDRVHNFLNIFGHLITNIYLHHRHHQNEKSKEEILKTIAHFCGKTLQKLTLNKFNCDSISLSPFSALQTLDLQDSTLSRNCEVHLHITTLCLTGDVIKYKKGRPLTNWFVQQFPHLKVAKFHSINIKRNMLNQFLTLNPQLKILHLFHGKNLTSSILRDIGHRVPNLEQFRIGFRGGHRADNEQNMEANMIHISGLRKLKCLYIGKVPEFSLRVLIDSLIENNIPIENFRFYNRSHSLHSTTAMQTIKKLLITDISNDEMIETIKKMTQLEELLVDAWNNVNLSSIKKVLKYGENLKFFAVSTNSLEIDSGNYDSLLVLAKGRVKVEIHCLKFTSDVPEIILEENRMWIDIFDRSGKGFITDKRFLTFYIF